MKHRNRAEVLAGILESASARSIPFTRIVYKTFLSHHVAKTYLNLLVEHNLLDYAEVTKTFRITKKGLRFLEIFNQLNELTGGK